MVDRKCSKNFPKQFCNHTSLDLDGFPLYRRRNYGNSVEKSGVHLDNINVVPYNKYMLKRYHAHINVEWYPAVIRLPFHLPGQQQVMYEADDDIEDVLDRPSNASSMFISWMKCNETNKEARKLTYVEFPTKFVWKPNLQTWKPREVGRSIGRIHSVSPKLGEAYFLRILLNKVKGPKSFEEIRTVNGEICSSFKDACYNLGLLDDDKEYIEAIKEASLSGSGFYLCFLFATMLLSTSLCKPKIVWENTWEYLSDGILYTQQKRLNSPGLSLNEDQIKNLTLFEIEQILLRNNSSLKNYRRMPYPDLDSVSSSNNRLIAEELDYDIPNLKNDFDRLFVSLTNEQRNIFQDIMAKIKNNKGGVFFIYGYGGTGKPFLWKTISAAIRSQVEIVLNVASSGIASLLLTGGRTAHSRFIIPINLTEDSFCKINPKIDLAILIRKASLIIWDEAPMVHKHAFEALDRTLKDILKFVDPTNSSIPFGGKVVVFGGDFRQILPVVPGGSRQNIVNASLSSSYLWQQYKVHKLTKNMRLTVGSDPFAVNRIEGFSNWLLDIGEGNLGGPNDGEAIVDIPEDILINDLCDPIGSLINFKNGLCNGTRLQIKSLGKRVIEAFIISGSNIGNRTFIPRMSLTPSENKIPFKFQRRQFPLVVCFAMTINKSQGQSLSKVGLFLKDPVFTHGKGYRIRIGELGTNECVSFIRKASKGETSMTVLGYLAKLILGIFGLIVSIAKVAHIIIR
ncbi:hypothetical protein Lser_V15G43784 [Lactuca serriola]